MTAAEQYLHAHVGLQVVMPTPPFHGSTAAAALTISTWGGGGEHYAELGKLAKLSNLVDTKAVHSGCYACR